MPAPLPWAGPAPQRPAPLLLSPQPALPTGATLWRGSELGPCHSRTRPTGFAALDAELPGQGWPCGALTEVLQAQSAVLEWRLTAPALRTPQHDGGRLALIGPPRTPHAPGLHHSGLAPERLVWVQADSPQERLWATEQCLRSQAFDAVLAWLPQARPEQIRRLQVGSGGFEGLVFLFRPEAARHEASAAPLRLLAQAGLDWTLEVQLLKRRGPAHEAPLQLASVPGTLARVLTPRMRQPSRLLPAQEHRHVVGRPAAPAPARQRAAA